MGQKVGKAKFIPQARPFLNMSKETMQAMWNNFNEIAEGFGLNVNEFQKIMEIEGIKATAEDARAVFKAMDTDNNELVDALEFLTTFALSSGLSQQETIAYTFRCYDFDESGELTVDEMTLSMKSTLAGLSKLTGEQPPDTLELEDIAQQAFSRADKNTDGLITFEEYEEYCMTNPEVSSWMDYFDDPEEELDDDDLPEDSELEDEAAFDERSEQQDAARHPEKGVEWPELDMEGGGDQFLSVKPYAGTVKNMQPTNPPAVDERAPDVTLELEWVHGYRAQDTRNNVRYTAAGEIAYHSAAVGIVYAPGSHTQRFNLDHTDDIVSMAVHPEGHRVATGQMGRKPQIVIWDCTDTEGVMDSVVVLKGYHRRAVIQLAFSPNGRYLASVGQDDDHSVAVYDWESGKKIYAERGSKEKVLACCWLTNTSFVTCGVKHIYFWDLKAKRKAKGIFGKAKAQALTSAAALTPSTLVTGTVSGHLYLWSGRNCTKTVKAHASCAAALFATKDGLVSGGKDGKVRLWSLDMHPGRVFDISTFNSVNMSVRSVAWDTAHHKLLVGTMGSEIYEINAQDGENLHDGPIVAGHCADELWGLAVHPAAQEYVTTGDDHFLRRWDVATRKLLGSTDLGSMARAVGFSPDGSMLAIGLGGDVGRGRRKKKGGKGRADGGFLILSYPAMQTLHRARDASQWISDIKFSPNGGTLGVGSHDNRVYLYSTEDWGLLGTASKHHSYITHFDFSDDSNWIRTNSGDYELLFFDARTGDQQTSAPSMKDVHWATGTCTLGWEVQGIWPPCADGTDVNSVCRAHDDQTLATADDFGRVKLFRYPVVTTKHIFHEYAGHSSHVTNCRFTAEDRYLITTGGNDRSVLQWRCMKDADEDVQEAKMELDSDDELMLLGGDDIARSDAQEAANDPTVESFGIFELDDGAEETKGGDQFMATKPWMGNIVEPTTLPKLDASTPDDELALEWIHGYRCTDARNNVRYNKAGEIVYTAAAVGVVYNLQKHSQRFNTSHTDDVICMAMHPDGIHIATGQMGRKPQIVIWDSTTMETKAIIQGLHRRAVCQLAFSADGRMLASVGQDDDHTCAVYDWQNKALKCQTKGSKGKTLGLAVSPNGKVVCQVGVKHIKFHTFAGRSMKSKKATLGRKGCLQPFLAVEYVGNNALVACQDGHVYQFADRGLAQAVKAHDDAVYALYVSSQGIITGGKDGFVKTWSHDLAPKSEFSIASLSPVRAIVRSVAWNDTGSQLLVGTMGSEIYELNAHNGKNLHKDLGAIVRGHCKYELWGLAVHPSAPQYATVGDDATLRVWDAQQHKQLGLLKLSCIARAVAYSPKGDLLAIGLGGRVGRGGSQKQAGTWVMVRTSDLTITHTCQDSRQAISDVKFSPDGKTLAVGSHDNKIYLYDADTGTGSYPLRCVFDKHNSYVTHLDFSEDSKTLQSNCGAYELHFSDVATGAHHPAASRFKDTKWDTWTCILGWPVQKIWPPRADGTDINAVSRSHHEGTLATADDFGKVKLFRYPCVKKGSAFKEYVGHSSHVTNVRWTAGDKHLISTGGNDLCIFQWAVERDEAEASSGYDVKEDDSDVPLATEGLNTFEYVEEEGGGDRFMATKPWKGAIVEPSNPPDFDTSKPKMNLELEWVYGYRAQDARNNLRYNDAGEIVYTSAAVGIIYDKTAHRQKFYIGHDDDIVCLAVDRSGNFVATGQMGRKPTIHIWDSETGVRLAKLPALHKRAVTQVAFDDDGKRLLSVGEDDDHTIAIWSSPSGSWTDAVASGKCKSDKNKVLFANFAVGGGFGAVTGGVRHIRFWTVQPGRLRSKRGAFGRNSSTVICTANMGGKILTGSASGHIYIWGGTKIAKAVNAHKGSVAAMSTTRDGLVSGDATGQVRMWNAAMEMVASVDMTGASPAPISASIRSVCMNDSGSLLLVGTQGSEIYEVSTSSRKITLLSEGHCRDELWGLDTHPRSANLFATAGDDKTVRVWNLADHRLVSKTTVNTMSRAVAWSPDGSMLGCGLGGRVGGKRKAEGNKFNGGMVVLRPDSMEVIHYGRDSKQWIGDVKFSPDGSLFGVGSHDNKVYLYDARGGRFMLKGACSAHNSYITHFDFSSDSAVIQSNCGAYELLYHNTTNCDQIKSASSQRDTEWATWTCILGWPVEGIFPPSFDGTDINSVARSHNNQWVATTDDMGQVKVYNWPCRKNEQQFVLGEGHSSHVTNARWTLDDSYLITTGGNDRSIFQWRVAR